MKGNDVTTANVVSRVVEAAKSYDTLVNSNSKMHDVSNQGATVLQGEVVDDVVEPPTKRHKGSSSSSSSNQEQGQVNVVKAFNKLAKKIDDKLK